ncbi:hypothetical protein H8D30_01975 [bacterium]|nr:hypothetical protein [bacterium]
MTVTEAVRNETRKGMEGFLDQLVLGEEVQVNGGVVLPLMCEGGRSDRLHITLGEALERGAKVEEISESGSVPTLLFKNSLPLDVLGLEGEMLVGAKQNRLLNTAFLSKAGEDLAIPVSCVESGRWGRSRRRDFGLSTRMVSRFVKGTAKMGVSQSAAQGGWHSNQGDVWDSVSLEARRMGVHSGTSDLDEVMEGARRRHPVSETREQVARVMDGAVGYALAIEGKWKVVEIVGCLEDASRVKERWVETLALDLAIPTIYRGRPRPESSPLTRLRPLLAKAEVRPSVGLGFDIRAHVVLGDSMGVPNRFNTSIQQPPIGLPTPRHPKALALSGLMHKNEVLSLSAQIVERQ